MRLLFLTSVTAIPTEEGEKRIEKALKKEKEDDLGFAKPGSAKWFEEMNITPPQDLEEEEVDEISDDGFIILPEDEIQYEFNDLVIDMADFMSCEETSMISSILTTKSGQVFEIEETPEMVFYMIYMNSRPWYEKIKDWVKEKTKIK